MYDNNDDKNLDASSDREETRARARAKRLHIASCKEEGKKKRTRNARRMHTLVGKLLKIHPPFCSRRNDRSFPLYRMHAPNGVVRAIAATNDE